MLEFGNSTYPKARKDYRCDLCGHLIRKGESYHRWCGKYDGDMFDLKYHKTCQKIINAYCEAQGDDEYSEDCILDWLRDEYCLDCKLYEDDECEEFPISCPHIRKKFEA